MKNVSKRFSQPIRRPRTRRAGFTMMEVVLALTVFLMMTLMFGATLPVALRGTQQGSNYTEAALLAQHKMDRLRAMGFGSLGNYTSLSAQGAVDAVNANGSYDFSTTASDNLAAFFPAGTTGTITIAPDTNTGTMQGGVYDVTVTIAWPDSAAPAGSFTIKNKIINY